ncbi:SRPBCC family protein [Paraherbaspirillum soli]|uniref:SRPBCC family protein n=1 Tax=Paraherbaspirillum soli TaxID=631222 RepID=A0ABW0M3X5_9BURK
MSQNKKQLVVVQKIELSIPVEKTWEILKDFNGMSAWHPVVVSSKLIEGSNNQEGAVRLMSLQDGSSVTEKLLAYSDQSRSIAYGMVDGQLPVSDYVSVLTAHAAGQGSIVIWQGAFKRKDDNPAAGADDDAAKKIINAVYAIGLNGLKQRHDIQ